MRINRYESEDSICHYTKASSALKILETKSILLSPRTNTYDYIEVLSSKKYSMGKISHTRENYQYMSSLEVELAAEEIVEYYNSACQTCFCKTNTVDKYQPFMLDDYCFMRQRMWEQYGDLYAGIGLILSKKKLVADNPSVEFRDVDYRSMDFVEHAIFDKVIDIDSLKDNYRNYLDSYKEQLLPDFFIKGNDYRDENEFRALRFKNKREDVLSLDISTGIKAIAYFRDYPFNHLSSRFSGKEKSLNEDREKCLELARNLGIDIFVIDVDSSGTSISTEQELIQQFMEIENVLQS